MNWIDITKEKPKRFAYFHACDVNSGQYLGELLWKPCYESFFETRSRWSLNGIVSIEDKISNVTHWIERDNISLPSPAIVLDLQTETIELSRREVEVFDNAIDNMLTSRLDDETHDVLTKVSHKFWETLVNE